MKDWFRRRHWDIYYDQIPLISAMLRMCGRGFWQTLVKRKGTLNPTAIDHEHFGRAIEVTAEKIKCFALATNETNPRYFQAPQVAPPMFASVSSIFSISKLFNSEHLNLDFAGMFHAGQDVEFFRLVKPGDQMSSKSFVTKIVDKGKGEILVTNTHGFDQNQQILFKAYSSWYVKKPRHLHSVKPEEFREQLYWEPETGATMRSLDKVRVASNQMMRYAKISGDYNFVHISDIVAKLFGNEEKILQGLCTMAFIAKAIVDGFLAGQPQLLQRLNIRFLNNVKVGDTLETLSWDIDPTQVAWSSFWLKEQDRSSRLIGFKTVNQAGDVVVSRGVAKVASS